MKHPPATVSSTTLACIDVLLLLVQSSYARDVDVHLSPQEFCYSGHECGPDSIGWAGRCHNGTRQSPINLIFPRRHQPVYAHLPLHKLRSDYFFLQNNGHTINLIFPISGRGFFPGHGLTNKRFKFANAHLHWGKTTDVGSEHLIDGESYSMELHLVHYKHKYKSLSRAISSGNPSAVAVVAVFLQVSHSTPPNPALAPIIRNLYKIHEKHSYWEKVDELLDFTSLIPVPIPGKSEEWMYHYKGSLTTPGCNEDVYWYVFEKPSFVSPSDVQAFRSLNDGHGKSMMENHRPVQPQMGRRVELLILE